MKASAEKTSKQTKSKKEENEEEIEEESQDEHKSKTKTSKQKKSKKEEKDEEIEEESQDEQKEKAKDGVAKVVLEDFEDFVDGLGTWKDSLKESWSSKPFKSLYDFLKDEYENELIYPPHDLIFNAFKLTPLNNVKVVIIGQDPYHEPKQAMGLAFSVSKEGDLRGVKLPSSVKNIYKSLETDPAFKDKFKKPDHGDLTKWAKQGVFLLNNILTVKSGKPNSHKTSGWKKFTDDVIKLIDKECDKVVFLVWGADAHKKVSGVDEKKHHVLKTSHPSGQSFTKGFNTACPFSKCNEYLKKNGLPEIDWTLDA